MREYLEKRVLHFVEKVFGLFLFLFGFRLQAFHLHQILERCFVLLRKRSGDEHIHIDHLVALPGRIQVRDTFAFHSDN